jgi:hypothetical protein
VTDDDDLYATVQQEIDAPLRAEPHVVLLGAGASVAALPNGDLNGRQVPLLREVATELNLAEQFPEGLRELAGSNFEAAYSRLHEQNAKLTTGIDELVKAYFAQLKLPVEPTIYDTLLLSLRGNDAMFTFNWDPFLFQAHVRLQRAGIPRDRLPTIWFLHGNVAVAYCLDHEQVRGLPGTNCWHCGNALIASRLLFPVEHKDYQDGSLIEWEWKTMRKYLPKAFMLTVFGYSAPATDVEAKKLLMDAWGGSKNRPLEQIGIINRPDADHDELYKLWSSFIHTDHYDIQGSFYDSWIANHPRRTAEAYKHQYLDAKFIDQNSVPRDPATIAELVDWFGPLLEAERR